MKAIILDHGNLITFSNWQKENRLEGDKAAKYFSASELDCEGELLVSELLLKVLDKFREKWGKPVKINSGYRSEKKQAQLKAQGYAAATVSPHTRGMAADIDTSNYEETKLAVKALRTVANDMNIRIRLGWNQYAKLGQSFVHVDVCPMYFAPERPYHNQVHPYVWETAIEW